MRFSDVVNDLELLSANDGLYEKGKVAWWLIKYEEKYINVCKFISIFELEYPGINLRKYKSLILELLFIELYENVDSNYNDFNSNKYLDLNEILTKINSSTNGLKRKDKNFKWDTSPR